MFSSSVFADDLTGKKIFCNTKYDNNVKLIAFEFKNKKIVKIYEESNLISLVVRDAKYKTSVSIIQIIEPLSDLYLPMVKYKIDRRNLTISLLQGHFFPGRDCELTNKNIYNLFKEAMKEVKNKNLL